MIDHTVSHFLHCVFLYYASVHELFQALSMLFSFLQSFCHRQSFHLCKGASFRAGLAFSDVFCQTLIWPFYSEGHYILNGFFFAMERILLSSTTIIFSGVQPFLWTNTCLSVSVCIYVNLIIIYYPVLKILSCLYPKLISQIEVCSR